MEITETILSWFSPKYYARSKELNLSEFLTCLRMRRAFLHGLNLSQMQSHTNHFMKFTNELVGKLHENGTLAWPISTDELDNEFTIIKESPVKKLNGVAVNDETMNFHSLKIEAANLNREQLIKELIAYVDTYLAPNLVAKVGHEISDAPKILRKLHNLRALQYLDLLIIAKLYQVKMSARKMTKIMYADSFLDPEINYQRFKRTKESHLKRYLGLDKGEYNDFMLLVAAAQQEFVDISKANERI